MEKNDENEKIEIQKMKTKITFSKTRLSNCINKYCIYVLILINSIIASISSNKIKITISGSGKIRIMDINGREPDSCCIEGGECDGSQFTKPDNILYFNKENNEDIILGVNFDNKLSNLKGLFKNCKDIKSIEFQNFDSAVLLRFSREIQFYLSWYEIKENIRKVW